MKYGLYRANDGTSLSFIGIDAYKEMFQQGAIEQDAELIWTVDVDSWNEACALYHRYMGWEPYKPLDE